MNWIELVQDCVGWHFGISSVELLGFVTGEVVK
jgi:hypothetical protein